MKLGIVTMATGKYYKFLDANLLSFYKYFFPKHERKFIYLTDKIDYLSPIDAVSVHFPFEKWPMATLNKPKAINLTERYFHNYDIIFWVDVDLNCIDYVECESDIFPTPNNPITCVTHCGWLDSNGKEVIYYPYEKNKNSTAYVEDIYKVPYHQACFFGGFKSEFFKMTTVLEKNINIDLANNIIAIWHDESHLNKYFQNNYPKSIPKIYARPEAMGPLIPNTKIKSILKNDKEDRNLE